ncbi:hypothetical protein EYF80_020849 [Liparis tanakae]|uniref:Uncharacterized protein n=1 Tax=Liparis tanakae TaxID=230148 RepID=A0A4Z2HTB0_9TELE|nr:hypothetical protein EYF80_020849 [Liparis tanakae]
MEVEKQSGQPCQPGDLPWPATATPPRGGKWSPASSPHHHQMAGFTGKLGQCRPPGLKSQQWTITELSKGLQWITRIKKP